MGQDGGNRLKSDFQPTVQKATSSVRGAVNTWNLAISGVTELRGRMQGTSVIYRVSPEQNALYFLGMDL